MVLRFDKSGQIMLSYREKRSVAFLAVFTLC